MSTSLVEVTRLLHQDIDTNKAILVHLIAETPVTVRYPQTHSI